MKLYDISAYKTALSVVPFFAIVAALLIFLVGITVNSMIYTLNRQQKSVTT